MFVALQAQLKREEVAGPARILLRGPAGSGKSWIVRELHHKWEDAVVLACGEPALIQRSYGAFWLGISTAGPRLSLRNTVVKGASAAGRTVPVVGSLVAYLTEVLSNNRARRQRDQALYLKTDEFDILAHLDAIGKRRPLLLIADDLQYWDQDSLQLLYLMVSRRLNSTFPFLEKMGLLATLTEGSPSALESPLSEIIALLPERRDVSSISVKELPTALRMFGLSISLSSPQLEMLHLLSGGHLELLRQLAHYIETHPEFSDLDELMRTNGSSVEQFLATILVRRLLLAGEEGRATLEVLEKAVVIGKTFTQTELECLLKPAGIDLHQCLDTAEKFGLLVHDAGVFSFRHEVLRNSLILHANSRLPPSHRVFADCLNLLRPFDYVARAQQLTAAGDAEGAARLYFAGLYKRIRDGRPVPSDLRAKVYKLLSLTEQLSSAVAILDAYEKIRLRNIHDAVRILDSCEQTDHLVFVAERTLLKGFAFLQSVKTSDRREALDELESCASLLHGEKELEIRCKLTLLSAYVHLGFWNKARRLDREISVMLSLLQRTDPGAREGLEVQRRKSGMLYGSEVAAERCRHAVAYFGPQLETEWPPRNPVQFFMAQCNLAGNLLVSGDFQGAGQAAQIALDTWSRLPNVDIPGLEKCLNNSVVSGVLGKRLRAKDAVILLQELTIQISPHVNSFIIRNNYAVFTALSDNVSAAREEFEGLAAELTREGIEDEFYLYLIRSNLAGVLHVMGDTAKGRRLWNELANSVPGIPGSDREYLLSRQKLQAIAFDRIPPGNVHLWNNYLGTRWPNHLGAGWRFYGQGFMLSDSQIWSES